MKFFKVIALILATNLWHIPIANANFGLGPCCSGVTCGIIPCDASCGGRAILTMGTSFASNITRINASSNQLTTNAQNTNQPLVNYYTDLGNSLQQRTSAFLSGLDALTIRIDTTKSQEVEAWQSLGDNLANQFHYAASANDKSKSMIKTSRTFGAASQPSLLQAITNHSKKYALAIAESSVKRDDLLMVHETSKQLLEEGQSNKTETVMLPQFISKFLSPFDVSQQFTDENMKTAMTSLALISDDNINTSALVASEHLSSNATDENNISSSMVETNSVLSPIIDPDMIISTTSLNITGLQRHIITQQQIEQMLTHKIAQKRTMRNRYLAEIVVSSTK